MEIKKYLGRLNTIIIVFGAIGAIAGVYAFYKSELWHPTIEVITVDYNKGEADLKVNGKVKKLYSNSVLCAGGVWGIRFNGDANSTVFNRIEIVKGDLVYGYIY